MTSHLRDGVRGTARDVGTDIYVLLDGVLLFLVVVFLFALISGTSS